jgi:lipopolysaccharide transport system ATP-binding protein
MSQDNVIISAENIGKCYTLDHRSGGGGYRKFSDTLIHAAKAPLRWLKTANGEPRIANRKEEFWALKDVSFEIKRGEVVGIIGRNGAGKSTLLKILSRITEPTKGRITLDGRVASLLEVGTGFHPELTGRENIFLNGAILGMRKEEIKAKFDEIVAFAEIEKFLDTPVKRYSSGMYVRLAFAVAAHLEPEILIVDEVLAVGDAQFQAKCLGKMQDVARGGGRTVLFVSHNMTAVQTLCQRSLWLRSGELIADGKTESVVHSYLNSGGHMTLKKGWQDCASAPGNDFIKIKSAEVRAANDESRELLIITEPIQLIFELWTLQDKAELNLSVTLRTSMQEYAFNTISEVKLVSRGLFRGVCHIPAHLLNTETYSVDLYVVQDTSTILHIEKDILTFEAVEGARNVNWYGKWLGAVRPLLNFPLNQD